MWLFPPTKTPKPNIRPMGAFSPEKVDDTHIGDTGEASLPNVPVNARASDWAASPLRQKKSISAHFASQVADLCLIAMPQPDKTDWWI